MTYDLKTGYRWFRLVTTYTMVFFREALAQLGAKREEGRIPLCRRGMQNGLCRRGLNPYLSISRKNAQNICIGQQAIHLEESQAANIFVLFSDVFFISLYKFIASLHYHGSEQAL